MMSKQIELSSQEEKLRATNQSQLKDEVSPLSCGRVSPAPDEKRKITLSSFHAGFLVRLFFSIYYFLNVEFIPCFLCCSVLKIILQGCGAQTSESLRWKLLSGALAKSPQCFSVIGCLRSKLTGYQRLVKKSGNCLQFCFLKK